MSEAVPQPEAVAIPLPAMFQEAPEVPYSPAQLEPTIARLRAALAEFEVAPASPQQQLAAAWTRLAELRLPRKAVPVAVLDDIEELLLEWDRFQPDGIRRRAMSLSESEVLRERGRIAAMLDVTIAAADAGAPAAVPTE
jgi:hypothetical protein